MDLLAVPTVVDTAEFMEAVVAEEMDLLAVPTVVDTEAVVAVMEAVVSEQTTNTKKYTLPLQAV
ncbi:hypothetical protein HanXRQr2_Chr13g0589941 [Helianthus annuus]|uniref:Uncharacterized protein n=1 Tax=Helianthus annuus TaxID=4232 RepID=A0A9K3HC36_HELAN|nr:hypothetical protein HanXRQr2_Chr13g0589941 [Helianthus annuus]KAJ0497863.1 hypothetical protein HanHA89_Chr13g0515921 [Helianthus annuus]KAJ0671359.1 hypothetical protein HanOQP8_Chr13g0484641 [Helianthus annuus]